MRRLKCQHHNPRTARRVIGKSFLLGKYANILLLETELPEPVKGLGCEHKKLFVTSLARGIYQVRDQLSSDTELCKLLVHRKPGNLSLVFVIRLEIDAPVDRAVYFIHIYGIGFFKQLAV